MLRESGDTFSNCRSLVASWKSAATFLQLSCDAAMRDLRRGPVSKNASFSYAEVNKDLMKGLLEYSREFMFTMGVSALRIEV